MQGAKKLSGLLNRSKSVGVEGAKKLSSFMGREVPGFTNNGAQTRASAQSQSTDQGVVPIQLIRKAGGEVQIEGFIASAVGAGLWVVAWDHGDYQLCVGSKTMGVAVVSEREIAHVLSHRWSPAAKTAIGPLPLRMMDAAYPVSAHVCVVRCSKLTGHIQDKTWVDFLNHFNMSSYTQRVVESMGNLYATKSCRALYFENSSSSIEEIAEACSRCWMWQELSIGPQMHAYTDAKGIFLHYVVRVGEERALNMVHKLAGFAGAHAVSAVLDNLATGKLQAAGIDDAVRNECQRGTLASILAAVLHSHGFHDARGALTTAIIADVSAPTTPGGPRLNVDANRKESLAAAAQLLRWTAAQLVKSADIVFRARKIANEELSAGIKALSAIAAGFRLVGVRAASNALSLALVSTLEVSEKEDTKMTSAVANFRNKNVTVDADRLVASFGVLCAAKGVRCDAASVTHLLWTSPSVTVQCVSAADAQGMTAAMRRRVELKREGKEEVGEKLGALFNSACMVASGAGTSMSEANYTGVWLSGFALGPCNVQELGGGVRQRLGAKMAGVQKNMGEIMSYTLEAGGVSGVFVRLDAAKMLEIRSKERLALGNFKAWFEALPVG